MASARGGGGGSHGSMYDVFVSFRGPDTRDSFVDFLYEYMTLAGIRVFVDNERLHVGEKIGEELMRAIDDSKICIPVFSKRYASSKWCLLELERIMMNHPRQEVLPVFYKVSPYDVKLQTRLYSDDLEALEKKDDSNVVDRWRKCLKEVCKIKGWNLEESKGQGKLIKTIVQEVLFKTKKRYMNVTDHIVGIEGQVEAIMKLLDDRINIVRFVIIHGMGGIGKTTLAKVIFNEVSSKFQGCSFISNVRESSQGNGILRLQQQILNDVLRTSVNIYDVDTGINEIRERCSNKKVLLVLDDVDERDQVRNLAGMFDWFGSGSRIIITTRDVSVVPIRQKNEREDDPGDVFYEMQEMDYQTAMTLFKRHAIGDVGNSFDDGDLLDNIVATTGGLPLALEVVGSHLFCQKKAVWGETLRKLKQAPHKKVQNALMISYESLEDDEKQIFLDIACFFHGIEKRLPMYMWEASDLYPESGLNALLHKSLIKMDDGDKILMHDQLRDLGRKIVHSERKFSRIWIPEEAFRMISDKKGTSDVVLLDLGELSESCKFKDAEFKELVNLRVLRLSGGNLVGDFSECFSQLRWLEWSSFPSNFQAKIFGPPNLAVLRLQKTDIDERWIGWNRLLGSKLKFLELSACGGLTTTPDFSTCLGLEMLVIQHCNRLTEIDSSIGKLEQLTHLEIRGSLNLHTLPQSLASLKRIEKLMVTGWLTGTGNQVKFRLPSCIEELKSLCHLAIEHVGLESLPEGIGQLKLLEYLSFYGCVHLTSLPKSVWELESLTELNLAGTGLTGFLGKIENMKKLKVLKMNFTNIRMLPEGIGSLEKLEVLDVCDCPCLEQIPSEIGNLFSLRVLNLKDTNIRELPSTVSRLTRLQHLDMYSCPKLRKVEQLPASLSHLSLQYFSLQVIPDLSNLVNLVHLGLFSNEVAINIIGIPVTDDEEVNADRQARIRSLDFAWIGRMQRLKRLVIAVQSDIFNFLQVSLRSLSSVEVRLSCSDTQSLSHLPPTLSTLVFTKFRDTTLQMSLYPHLKNLVELDLCNSLTEEIKLEGLEVLENLQCIIVWYCHSLVRLSISSCPKKLNSLRIMQCNKLVDFWGVDRLESLHSLWFMICPSLRRLPDLSNLVKIKDLRMHHCNSMERMPALPRKERPFDLEVINCGKLPGFVGPHNLYGEHSGGKEGIEH